MVVRKYLSLAAGLLLGMATANDETNSYTAGEEVTVWTNKVGPYHNPQETYDYHSLPFCKPNLKTIKHKSNSLGVLLEGSDLVDSGLHIQFKEPQTDVKVCNLVFDKEKEQIMVDAVKNHYWYQMYIDELPIWGMVGEYMVAEGDGKEQGFIYTHQEYSIGYNGDKIIEVNLTVANPMPIVAGESHPFTYSTKWVPTNVRFEDRYDRYHDFDFFEHQIHWFSIFNSFMMVVFLCGLVALILMRTLKNDYARFTSEDEDLELDRVVDESGWKQVHGDVFRPPRQMVLYSACLGTGYQLFFLAFCAISLIALGEFYHERGTIVTVMITCYSLTSFINGYASSTFYKRNNGTDWKKAMTLSALMFPGSVFAVLVFLNVIAVGYGSSQYISFWSMLLIVVIFCTVSLPLVVFGTIAGRSMSTPGDFPCRVNALMRPIPDGKWFTKPTSIILFSGILPFGSIFIEMYFVFTSFWNYKFYYVYGFMLLVYCILIIVTVCVTIVATYFLLNAEDYRWHWTSFLSGASTALYVFIYSIYYFLTKTRMSGMLQTAYYFAYMGIFSASLGLLGGTIGYMGTSAFVNRIYQYIKSD